MVTWLALMLGRHWHMAGFRVIDQAVLHDCVLPPLLLAVQTQDEQTQAPPFLSPNIQLKHASTDSRTAAVRVDRPSPDPACPPPPRPPLCPAASHTFKHRLQGSCSEDDMVQGVGGGCPVLQLICMVHRNPQLKLGLLHQPLGLYRQHQVATTIC